MNKIYFIKASKLNFFLPDFASLKISKQNPRTWTGFIVYEILSMANKKSSKFQIKYNLFAQLTRIEHT